MIGSGVVALLSILTVYFALQSRQDLREARAQFEIASAARARSEAVAAEARVLAAEAQRSADELREVAQQLPANPTSSGAYARTTRTAQTFEQLADKLSKVNQPSSAVATGPRVYFHISDNRSRTAAREFERALEGASIDGMKVIVPGIELVKASPPRSVLRCFSNEECRGEARRIVDLVNALLVEPQVELQDLSDRYGESTNIRPRHYELWFAPGNITLRSDKRG
jgi:hypothetical protein